MSYWVLTVFTRHTIPAPGSSSSSSHVPAATVAGASGPSVIDAVLRLSSRFSGIFSGRNHSPFTRLVPLIPLSTYISFSPSSFTDHPKGFQGATGKPPDHMNLPFTLIVNFPLRCAS